MSSVFAKGVAPEGRRPRPGRVLSAVLGENQCAGVAAAFLVLLSAAARTWLIAADLRGVLRRRRMEQRPVMHAQSRMQLVEQPYEVRHPGDGQRPLP